MMPKDKDQLPSAECWGVAGDRRASVLVIFWSFCLFFLLLWSFLVPTVTIRRGASCCFVLHLTHCLVCVALGTAVLKARISKPGGSL